MAAMARDVHTTVWSNLQRDLGTVALQPDDPNHEDSDLDLQDVRTGGSTSNHSTGGDTDEITSTEAVTKARRTVSEDSDRNLQDVQRKRGSTVSHASGGITDEEEITSPESVVNVRHPDQQKTPKEQSAEEDEENKRIQERDIRTQIERLTSDTADLRALPVCIDGDQVTTNRGQYRNGKEFSIQRKIGSGGFSVIWEVEDKGTGRKHAMKMVTAEVPFSRNEALCMFDLRMYESFPALYLLGRYGSDVELHIEKINGVTLSDVIECRKDKMPQGSENVLFLYACTMLYFLLGAIQEMHDKGWYHNDLHGGNVMLPHDIGIILKVLDFGMAKQVDEPDEENDICCALCLFFRLCVKVDPRIGREDLKECIKNSGMSEQHRMKANELVNYMYQPEVDIAHVMAYIKEMGVPLMTGPEMKQAQKELFPDLFRNQPEIDVQEVDGAGRVPPAVTHDIGGADDEEIHEDMLQSLTMQNEDCPDDQLLD